MKKALLILAVVSLSVLSFGQQKQTTTTKTKADTTKMVHKKSGAATTKAATKTVAPNDMNKTKKDTGKVKK
jgi:hypothetical protein